MENQEITPKQIMLNYGLLLGFASILISVTNYAIGDIYKPHWIVSIIGTIISILFIAMGIKKIKEINNGYLALGEAIKTGLGITLVSAIIFVVYFFVFTNFIETEFYVRMLEVKEQAILEQFPNMPDEQFDATMDIQKKLNGPIFTSGILLIINLLFGLIISLIVGLIMKKTDEEITSI